MSWITIIWSMAASACLTLAGMHLLIWLKQRRAWANLLFSVTAASTSLFSACELWMMRSETTSQFGTVLRFAHVPGWVISVSLVIFVRFYMRAGRPWLAWLICGLRTLALLLNFLMGQSLIYREITRLRHIPFLGESVSVPEGIHNPWMLVGQLGLLLLVVYVADATLAVWRRGDRRQAVVLGGSIVFFIVTAALQSVFIFWGIVNAPITASLFFMGIVVAMAYELSRDAFHVVQLGRELQESEQRLALASDSANLGVWIRDLIRNEIWATDKWRTLFGFTKSEPLVLDKFLQRVHPDDREGVLQVLTSAPKGNGGYEKEYRVVLANEQTRWIASRGQVEFDGRGKAVRVSGVSMDITQRKLAELEAQQRRSELAHLSRVTTLGELSSSLAHELNQPLGAILRNTEAAELFLEDPSPDLDELRAILVDIRKDDQRAGAVIDGIRSMLKRRKVEHSVLDLNVLLSEVISLVRPDAELRKVQLVLKAASSLPPVRGDRVQLQQVLLNLLLNAMDAMNGFAPDHRRVTVRVQPSGPRIEVAVSDTGQGIPTDQLTRLFEPFYTTKPNGIGLGLPISRSILETHGGSIRAENDPNGGATFYLTLPLANEESTS